MSDAAVAPPPTAASVSKKGKGASKTGSRDTAKKAKAKPSHPKTADMVNSAIKNQKERNGSSLQAIKKYISANYKVDAEKMAPFIRKYLKAAVTSGSLVQTKGKGASGSFKFPGAGEKVTGKKSKTGTPAKMKVKKVKVSSLTMKSAKLGGEIKKPVNSPKKTVKAAKPAATSPSKAKKTRKAPTKKPKAPKPKKTVKSKAALK